MWFAFFFLFFFQFRRANEEGSLRPLGRRRPGRVSYRVFTEFLCFLFVFFYRVSLGFVCPQKFGIIGGRQFLDGFPRIFRCWINNRPFTEFYRVLPSFTEFYRVLPSFTDCFYHFLSNQLVVCFSWAEDSNSLTVDHENVDVESIAGLLPSFTEFYRVLPSFFSGEFLY